MTVRQSFFAVCPDCGGTFTSQVRVDKYGRSRLPKHGRCWLCSEIAKKAKKYGSRNAHR